jgi:FlaA1/EpsC-like NDP-sugar epimerase
MRNRYLLVADVLAILLAAWAAFAFRFGWLFIDARVEFLPFLATALIVKVGVFFAFGLYRRFWRYAGFWDLIAIVSANSAASVLLSAVMVGARAAGQIPGLSRTIPPLDWLFALALTVGLRASLRAIAETRSRRPLRENSPRRRVLVIGAGDAGALVVREMQKNPQLGLQPVGFLDDDRSKAHKQIYGLPVLGPISELAALAEARRAAEVVIAIPTATGAIVRSIAERCQALGIASRVMPGIYEILDGQLSVSRLRNVDITDLLGRQQVHHSDIGDPSYLRGASVVITGAGGSIGSELCRQVAHAGPTHLMLMGHGENSIFEIAAELRRRFPHVAVRAVIADIRDQERLGRVFRQARPTIVFHAAAHKHVTLMEENAAEAVTNNIIGTRNVVEAALAVGVERFVLVSTDKAVAPTSVMGASKRVAELIVKRAARVHGNGFVIVRFGNVLGSRGSVVPIFKSQIERGGPVTVTHPDVERYFMTIPEAVHLILQAGGIGRGNELFVLDMGEPVRLQDLASDMIRLSGFEKSEMPIVFTGLRSGEKLSEILWEDGALVEPSERANIRRVQEPAAAQDLDLDDLIARLTAAAARDDHNRVVALLQEAVPSARLEPKPRDVEAEAPVLVRLAPG